jgi:hypothetical protein
MAVLKYYDGSDWEPVVSALQGPTGPTGAASTITGPTGATGATGPTGAALSPTYTSFTPTIAGAGWSAGNGVLSFRYIEIGELVHVLGSFILGSTSGKGAGSLSFSLPVTSAAATVGSCRFLDAGTNHFVSLSHVTDTSFLPTDITTSSGKATWSGVVSNQPFTWATNDEMYFNFTYRKA